MTGAVLTPELLKICSGMDIHSSCNYDSSLDQSSQRDRIDFCSPDKHLPELEHSPRKNKEQVLIEVEQFDPIAREVILSDLQHEIQAHQLSSGQNVWIPGRVLENYSNGKFKATLKDKYGDEVCIYYSSTSLASELVRFQLQWDDVFELDQYGMIY